tara:strand:- start:103 stop:333 length:231 start_codon:yes stop_codon:yes gene_type:complete
MNITKEKERLKMAIDKVEDPKILERINYVLSGSEQISLTDEQLSILRETRAEYIKNPSTLISFEEFDAEMKKENGL